MAEALLNVKTSLSLSTFVFLFHYCVKMILRQFTMIDPVKTCKKPRALCKFSYRSIQQRAKLVCKTTLYQISGCEVWPITHRIFTYLNEFVLVSTRREGRWVGGLVRAQWLQQLSLGLATYKPPSSHTNLPQFTHEDNFNHHYCNQYGL